MPTGGAFEYDWGAMMLNAGSSGVVSVNNGQDWLPEIYRRVLTKRIYPNGGSGNGFETRITFGQTQGQGTATSSNELATYDSAGHLLALQKHYFHGNPIPLLPFGEELFAGVGGRTTAQGYTADSVRQKFTQKERDNETGLDYFLARYYSSTQGRFTSPDPVGGRVVIPQSLNRYVYVLNNPLRLIDTDGLMDKDPWNRLTRQQQEAIEGKLVRQEVETRQGTRMETAQEAFNRMVQSGGATQQQIGERVATIQNFIAAAGGYSSSEEWQQITNINRVGRNTIEVSVSDNKKFLDALEKKGYSIKSRHWGASLGEAVARTSADHPSESARSRTPTIYDVQFHYANDRASDSNYGERYWFFHFDITSSNSQMQGPIGNAAGGMGHANNSQLTPNAVRMNLIHRQMVPVHSGCYADCKMPN